MPRLTPLVLALSLAGSTALAVADDAPTALPDRLQVMLQGESAAAMRELVEAAGGEISHDLPIINAVGAWVSPDQLAQLRESPAIRRMIDDLSLEPDAPPEGPPGCDVGGALEAEIQPAALDWRLYLKRGPAHLASLTLAWPEELGALQALSLGGRALPLAGQSPGELSVTFPRKSALALENGQRLQLQFAANASASTAPAPYPQRDFSIQLGFHEDCGTELIPGYCDYAADTWYPQVSGAAALHRLGVTGRGVTVAVLDSGLWEHPHLARDSHGEPRIIGRYDAMTDRAGDEAFDESGHGTHMSSVLANSEPARTLDGAPAGHYKGIAPDARLVAVKAFNREGSGDMLDIVRGVQWVVEQREALDIRVLNLSFAARPRWPYFLDPINQALMRAWASGIVLVAAAGNEGPDPMTLGSPGNLPYGITVGAITDSWTVGERNDDYIPDFSSRGPTPLGHIKPDLVAPGGHMAALTRPGSTLTEEHPDYMISTGELVMTGTSQAAALVSGLVALLLQMQPELSPDEVKCLLTSSAEPAINRDGRLAYSPFEQGRGLVNVSRAITLGDTGCGNLGLDIQADMAGERFFEGPADVSDANAPSLPGLDIMLAPQASEKGPSDSRRWGVKDHIERPDLPPQDPALPFDWAGQYARERARIEALQESRLPPDRS
ncbi:MAG: alkaline serine protease [Haliea sp.]|nr:alkaline serine protease [Haliea sp.]